MASSIPIRAAPMPGQRLHSHHQPRMIWYRCTTSIYRFTCRAKNQALHYGDQLRRRTPENAALSSQHHQVDGRFRDQIAIAQTKRAFSERSMDRPSWGGESARSLGSKLTATPEWSNGRVVVGKFACFDKQQNILLNEAREWRWDAAKVRSERMVGTVIVPRQHLMSCHVLVEHKEAPEAAG